MLSWPTLIAQITHRALRSRLTQLGAVITQNNGPLAFFSGKLSPTQQKYSVTKQELLAIVETL